MRPVIAEVKVSPQLLMRLVMAAGLEDDDSPGPEVRARLEGRALLALL